MTTIETQATWRIARMVGQSGDGSLLKEVLASDGGRVAMLACSEINAGPVGEARLRLIAAAPELLAAMVKAETLLAISHPRSETLSDVRAAIVNAGGGA